MNGRIVVLAGVLGVMSCNGTEPTSPAPVTSTAVPAAPATPITVASVRITVESSTPVVGVRQGLFAKVIGSNGSVLIDPAVSWTSSDPGIVTVGPAFGYASAFPRSPDAPSGVAFAVRRGSATIIAAVGGRTDSVTITVVEPTTDRSVVEIDSFTVVEFQFDLPGFGPSIKCSASMRIGPGETADLFHEIYSDCQLL